MKFAVVASILVVFAFVSVKAKPNPEWKMPDIGQMTKMGDDFMKLGTAAGKAFTSFKPEEIQEILTSFQNQKERDDFMMIFGMIAKGDSMEDVANALLGTESGPIIAEKLMPLLGPITELKEKYGPALEKAKASGK